jgi:hypothetical protein
VIIFASRAVADEWWRTLSTTSFTFVTDSIKRVTPQLYTHNSATWPVWYFYDDARVKAISDPFRGKVFFQLQNDRGGRGIDIIPMRSVIDHISGNWWVLAESV